MEPSFHNPPLSGHFIAVPCKISILLLVPQHHVLLNIPYRLGSLVGDVIEQQIVRNLHLQLELFLFILLMQLYCMSFAMMSYRVSNMSVFRTL